MDTSNSSDFNSYLEKLRKEKNQMELRKILDTSYTTVSDIEHNKSYLTDKIFKICSHFLKSLSKNYKKSFFRMRTI